jgi:hypothetical protein
VSRIVIRALRYPVIYAGCGLLLLSYVELLSLMGAPARLPMSEARLAIVLLGGGAVFTLIDLFELHWLLRWKRAVRGIENCLTRLGLATNATVLLYSPIAVRAVHRRGHDTFELLCGFVRNEVAFCWVKLPRDFSFDEPSVRSWYITDSPWESFERRDLLAEIETRIGTPLPGRSRYRCRNDVPLVVKADTVETALERIAPYARPYLKGDFSQTGERG